MDVLTYVLDGLEQWLEVERECGVRSIEVDRSLLVPSKADEKVSEGTHERQPGKAPEKPPPQSAPSSPERASTSAYDFVFLHDRPLSQAGVEMMAKIVNAMGRTAETAPVVVAPPLPQARAYVVLGGLALKKYFPGVRGEPGMWVKSADGKDILVTYSPAFILRFPTVTEAVKKMKRDMWTSLKGVMQRFKGGENA